MFPVVWSYVPFCSGRETGRSPGRAEILETKPRTSGTGSELRLWDGVRSPSGRRIELDRRKTEGNCRSASAGRGADRYFGWKRPGVRPERFGDRGFGRGTRLQVSFGRQVANGTAARPARSHDRFGERGGPEDREVGRQRRMAARSDGSRKVERPEGARRRGDPESEREGGSFGCSLNAAEIPRGQRFRPELPRDFLRFTCFRAAGPQRA